jgi:hypothetical protein
VLSTRQPDQQLAPSVPNRLLSPGYAAEAEGEKHVPTRLARLSEAIARRSSPRTRSAKHRSSHEKPLRA